ncbi:MULTISPECIES: hypothetical protein [unclassified Solwaraspora]|uniref:hypothetical protein n=1 Tax=unclassified Solwaraspora TaxID=2627926 RepID=UPI00259BDF8E|nr:hypothetical protein [Solwaraspora sp. WMMA2056]WJK42651.1 hypothetical protein O7608_09885 [Solwaraspora sp. WMMA2056]
MEIQSWQIPLLVMAGIIVAETVTVPALRRWGGTVLKQTLRTASLGLLALLLVAALVVAALGPSLADQLASVAATISGFVALWLTWRSYRATAATDGDRATDRDRTADGDRTAGPPAG